MSEFGGLWNPACTVGWVAQLSQLAVPSKGNPNFPWEKSYLDSTVVKSKNKNKQKTLKKPIQKLRKVITASVCSGLGRNIT